MPAFWKDLRILVPALAALSLLSCGAGDDGESARWTLTWSDEFEGPVGQLPDAGKWRFDIGTGSNGWGNNQLEYDTNRPANVSLDGGGRLAITARREDFEAMRYTSGRINTRGFFAQAEGRFEARIKLPVGAGIWPAFWLLGDNFASVGWPACGEIDIMEYRGQEPRVVIGSLHGPGYSGGSAISRRFDVGGPKGLNEDYHVYAVEWSSSRITWFLDGAAYHSVTRRDLPSGGQWVFSNPFFIILNVAVGGNFVGSPTEATAFPQTMLVDWVRVYRLES